MASAAAVSALLRAYRPQFSSAEEQTAFAVHLVLLAEGFELLASGEKADSSSAGPSPSEEDSLSSWKDTPGVYSFLYSLPASATPKGGPSATSPAATSSGRATVKCLAAGDSLMVDACRSRETAAAGGTAGGQGERQQGTEPEVYHTEIRTSDYVAASYPLNPTTSSASPVSLFKNLDGLVSLVRSSIAQPLLGGGGKVGTTGTDVGSTERSQAQTQAQARSSSETQAEAERAREAARERETEAIRSESGGVHMEEPPVWGRPPPVPGIVYPPLPDQPGFGDDLTPGGGAGIGPTRGPGFPGSGMLVGPDDPRWGRVRPGPGIEDPDNEFFDQGPGQRPSNVPPGARFDPFGPPGIPGFQPGRFGEGPGRRGPPGGLHGDLPFFP